MPNGLAHELVSRGAGPETVVGVFGERSASLVIAFLAVTKAGAAYVPLDPAVPPNRLTLMLADAGARIVVAAGGDPSRLPPETVVVPVEDHAQTDAPVTGVTVDNLAYVLYTSGSTGQPKGVAITHRGVHRLVTDNGYAPLGPDETIVFGSDPSFDATSIEVWGALATGARLVVLDPATMLSTGALRQALDRYGVTTLFLTTALFNLLASEAADVVDGLGALLFGGEAADPSAVRKVLARPARPARLVNLYGPTETTTVATSFRVDSLDASSTVPIGGPIPATTAYVLDRHGRMRRPGAPGELYVGGPGVARGYVGWPALTAERFVPDPFSSEPGARLYRTGDRVRRNADGALEFLGRLDEQVKVRGFRIEPGEIEATLRAHDGVAAAVVTAPADAGGARRLVAYVVPAAGADASPAALRDFVRDRLPAHLVPATVMVLDALPLTRSGKVNRRALPTPEPAAARRSRPPAPGLEATIAAVWAAVLGVDEVGAEDPFFEIGGDSLLALRVQHRLEVELGRTVGVVDLFEHPTVAALARFLVGDEPAPEPARPRRPSLAGQSDRRRAGRR